MHKIVYIGRRGKVDLNYLSENISLLSGHEIQFVRAFTINEAMEHFFSDIPIVLMIIEDVVKGCFDFIGELKSDQLFEYLPIYVILSDNRAQVRKSYYANGADGFLSPCFEQDELLFAAGSAVKHKLKLDNVFVELAEVFDKSVTRGIQLELIKKFIPLSVWNKAESTAMSHSLEIPEEERELAIMFADIESFTTISESMEPRQVVEMLNDVFDIVSQIIYQNGGDIDKFIGDAFLAVFDSPAAGLFSAIMIQDELGAFNERRERRGEPVLKFRLGIHYGKVIRGSVGGTLRFDNTLIGDPINTTQRLEAASTPGGIVASGSLLSRIRIFNSLKLPLKDYELRGKNCTIKACDLYEYYKENSDIKIKLFKELNYAAR